VRTLRQNVGDGNFHYLAAALTDISSPPPAG